MHEHRICGIRAIRLRATDREPLNLILSYTIYSSTIMMHSKQLTRIHFHAKNGSEWVTCFELHEVNVGDIWKRIRRNWIEIHKLNSSMRVLHSGLTVTICTLAIIILTIYDNSKADKQIWSYKDCSIALYGDETKFNIFHFVRYFAELKLKYLRKNVLQRNE